MAMFMAYNIDKISDSAIAGLIAESDEFVRINFREIDGFMIPKSYNSTTMKINNERCRVDI